jgi:hypothetical protein
VSFPRALHRSKIWLVRTFSTFLVGCLSCVSLASLASAQPTLDAETIERARTHFDAGTQYYDAERFADAAHEFEEAYRLTGHPDVLYNLAQAHDRLEQYDEAIAWYRRYIGESVDDAPERSRVERRVRELETLRAAAGAPTEPSPEPIPGDPVRAPEPVEARGVGALPFIAMGVGAASIVAAIAFGIAASGIYADLESRCGVDGTCPSGAGDVAGDADRGATFATLADVFGIAGGVVLGVGVVLLAIELGRADEPVAQQASAPRLEITTGPTTFGAGARVRF